jgi:SpoVK/Ycf46/Vps4 family AAA+-type ATPase
MENAENLKLYDLVKLPDGQWQAAGEDLVLAGQVRHGLLRYGQWRLVHGRRGYSLLLLEGPPGVGKSDAARWAGDAAVRKVGSVGNGLVVSTAGLFDHLLGQSAKQVESIFADIALSARKSVTVVIFEDAEGLFISRQQSAASNDPTDVIRVTTALNQGIDKLRWEKNLLMFATLNMSGLVDAAILSRKAQRVSFALPTIEERREILKRVLAGTAGMRVLERLAQATEGWSGRELAGIDYQAFVQGTGSPEQLSPADFLKAVGLMAGTIVHNGNGVVQTSGREDTCEKSSNNGSPEAAIPLRSRLRFRWR